MTNLEFHGKFFKRNYNVDSTNNSSGYLSMIEVMSRIACRALVVIGRHGGKCKLNVGAFPLQYIGNLYKAEAIISKPKSQYRCMLLSEVLFVHPTQVGTKQQQHIPSAIAWV